MVYISIELFLLTSLYFGQRIKIKNDTISKLLFLMPVALICTVIMGLRSVSVGVDTKHYYELYNVIKLEPLRVILSSWKTYALEVGECLLIKLCSTICDDYFFFQFISALIYNVLIIKFIKKYSENYYIALSVFFGLGIFTMAFNITRQMLAVAILINSFPLLFHKKYFKYLCVVFFAMTFHTTAVLGLVVVLVYIVKDNAKLIRLLPVVGLVLAWNYDRIIQIASTYIKGYANYFQKTGTEYKYGLIRVVWLIIVILSCLMIYFNKSNDKQEKNVKEYFREILTPLGSLIYVVCYIIGTRFQYFERLGLYFSPFCIILFDCFGEKYIKNKTIRQLYYCGVHISFMILFFMSTLPEGGQYFYSFL